MIGGGIPPRKPAAEGVVLEYMQPMPSHVVLAMALGTVDSRACAQQELRNRGIGVDGAWGQFDHVAMQWDKYAQDHREVGQEMLTLLKRLRAQVPVGRGLSSADAHAIDEVVAKAEAGI